MLYQPSSYTQTHLNNIFLSFTKVLNSLEALAEVFKAPFLEPISKTAQSLLMIVQSVRQHKNDCADLIQQTSHLLYAIVSIYLNSINRPELPLSTLNHIAKFMETLHKIHTYVEAQVDTNKIRQFFHQGELSTLLKGCDTGLQEALDLFKVNTLQDIYIWILNPMQLDDVNSLQSLVDMQKYAEDQHQEVLQMIEALSEDTTSDRGSLMMFSTLDNRHDCNQILSFLLIDTQLNINLYAPI
ncbi:hypothetical protein C8R43DRAFT_950807 [Mycena crocata]|nr:hypothetical protein C8R43DRAFT_950807 [Mycena crocata]